MVAVAQPVLFDTAEGLIDPRSDAVSGPTPALRDAMARAEVGGAVFGDDPTVNALEERAAELLGNDAGLFVPTGTMCHLVAQLALLAPGRDAERQTDGRLLVASVCQDLVADRESPDSQVAVGLLRIRMALGAREQPAACQRRVRLGSWSSTQVGDQPWGRVPER